MFFVVARFNSKHRGAIQVKKKVRQPLASMKRKIAARLKPVEGGREPLKPGRPELTPTGINYEIAQRTQVTASGGMGTILMLTEKVELINGIDRDLGLLKRRRP